MGMAYDAARGQVVLFGGCCRGADYLGDTWTWDGTDWTKRRPAHSPRAGEFIGMAYDAARGQVVLYGGDTWTWDGTDWTKVMPAHSPPGTPYWGMAYDAAREQVVLFGIDPPNTWTWDGTDWTEHVPAHSPPARYYMGMAYDAARQQVVLFGGGDIQGYFYFGGTWTWDGTDWTKVIPAHSPAPRNLLGMAYDAAREQVVLFGGRSRRSDYVGVGDTWTWDGTDWTPHLAGSIWLDRRSGSPGSAIEVRCWGFAPGEAVRLSFLDSIQGRTVFARVRTDRTGGFRTYVAIPATATPGTQRVKARGLTSGEVATARFRVEESALRGS
jgi:hypothetical protein